MGPLGCGPLGCVPLGCGTSRLWGSTRLGNGQPYLDNGVHDRLGEHWLINLIVTKFPVANQVNNHIPEIQEMQDVPAGCPHLCQVALHSAAILDTSITASGSSAFTWKIGALTTRPGVAGVGGEPYLVVSNNVDCAPEK